MVKINIFVLIFFLLSTNLFSKPDIQYKSLMNENSLLINENLLEKVFRLHFIKPSELSGMVSELFETARLSFSDRNMILAVKDTKKNVNNISDFISKVDQLPRKLNLCIKIIEISTMTNGEFEHLLKKFVKTFSKTMSSTELVLSESYRLFIDFMIENGKATVLSKPNIILLNGGKSNIEVGDRLPYLTSRIHQSMTTRDIRFLESGVQLKVKAHYIGSNKWLLDIDAGLSTVKYWKRFGEDEYPVMSNRRATTTLTFTEGVPVHMAGLVAQNEYLSVQAIPFVSDIPLVGDLFKTQKNEIFDSDLIFLIESL